MSTAIDGFFDKLKKHLDIINNSNVDNEAMRHDLLIRPIITSTQMLGWNCGEVISQSTIDVPQNVRNSYYWDRAEPKKRRPDMIISPYGMNKTVAVIEEKKRQASLNALANKIGQLKEYQYLHNAVWGVLTDGEKWILQKNNEIFHTFSTLDDLHKNFEDFIMCIGKEALMERLIKYGTTDIVIVKPFVNMTLVLSLSKLIPKSSIDDYLMIDSVECIDFLSDIHVGWRNVILNQSHDIVSSDMYELVRNVWDNFLADLSHVLIGYKELILEDLLLNTGKKTDPIVYKNREIYRKLLDKWITFYPRISKLTADINAGTIWQVDKIMEMYAESGYPLLLSENCSATFLIDIIENRSFNRLPRLSREHIEDLYRGKNYYEK